MIWNSVILAFESIGRNAMRSLLTMLGIVIGVCAVITMVTIGNGATVAVQNQIESMGTNLLILVPGAGMGPNRTTGAPFDEGDAKAIFEQIAEVQAVSATDSKNVYAIYGNQNWMTSVSGADESYLFVGAWNVESGRSFNDAEFAAGGNVCIIGQTIQSELFGGLTAIGENMRLGRLSCNVIGVLRAKGQSSFGRDQDNIVLVPLQTFQRRMSGSKDITRIMISLKDGASSEKVSRDIEYLMRERRRISKGEDDDFSVRDPKELMEALTSTTRVMTMLLGAVAGVSLLVGGVGIMNIMLVSVTERTREIGIRLAIGALEEDVLVQFLVEAIVLSSLGGLIGILLGVFLSGILAGVMKVPLVLDIGIILISFLFAAFVGIVFGFFPASRAAGLNPIDALRHE